MPEIDVKLSQIAPSPSDASASTQVVGVQGGTSDLLYTAQQINNAPFVSTFTYRATTSSSTPRGSAGRWSDVINVKDFGAVGDNVADDTAAFQAAINVLASQVPPASWNVSTIGLAGKIYVPPGKYKLIPPVAGGPFKFAF